jgi:hypothetical protein
MTTRTLEIVAAVATASPKGVDGNQDRALAVRVGASGGGVVICDGVGSYAGSGAVAEAAAGVAGRHLQDMGIHFGTRGCAARVSEVLRERADGATTLIVVAADEHGDVAFCFVGNGSLLEVQMLDGLSGPDALRCIDLVLPHVSCTGGKPALRSFFPARYGAAVETSVGSYRVHTDTPRLYLACSDGIATEEERAVGRAPSGSVWKEIPGPLSALLDDLAPCWPDLLLSATAEKDLQAVLQSSLLGLLAAGELDDDATVGALLLRPASDQPGPLS